MAENIKRASIKDQIMIRREINPGLTDSDEVAKLKEEIAQSPFDGELRLALAKAYAAQFRFAEAIEEYSYVVAVNPDLREAYRMRGAYYLCTARYGEALADFNICCRMFGAAPDVLYRMGIVWYLQRQYGKAAEFFERGLEIALGSPEDGDQIIACIDWMWMSNMLSGKPEEASKTLERIPDDLVVGHHTDYLLRTELYRGAITVDEALEKCKDKPEMDYITSLYGIMIYCRFNGQTELAEKLFQEILAKDTYWNTFAYLATYAENNAR